MDQGTTTFANLGNGTYTVTPSKSGQAFVPAAQTLTISGSGVSGVNFAMQTWSISGVVSASSGTTLTLDRSSERQYNAGRIRELQFQRSAEWCIHRHAQQCWVQLQPCQAKLLVFSGANASGINFAASANPTWSISGTISPASLGNGSLVSAERTSRRNNER